MNKVILGEKFQVKRRSQKYRDDDDADENDGNAASDGCVH